MLFPSAIFHSLSNSGLKTAIVSAMLFTIGLYMYIGQACAVCTPTVRTMVSGCYTISHIGNTVRPAIVNAIHSGPDYHCPAIGDNTKIFGSF